MICCRRFVRAHSDVKVARIFTTDSHEFVTNDLEHLAQLKGVDRVEIVEMTPQEFFMIPATNASVNFFAPLSQLRDVQREP